MRLRGGPSPSGSAATLTQKLKALGSLESNISSLSLLSLSIYLSLLDPPRPLLSLLIPKLFHLSLYFDLEKIENQISLPPSLSPTERV